MSIYNSDANFNKLENSINSLVNDAMIADKIIMEKLRNLALQKFGELCKDEESLKLVVDDPFTTIFFTLKLDPLLNPELAKIHALQKIRDNLKKFENVILTMPIDRIHIFLSDMNEKGISYIIRKYKLLRLK